MYACFAICGEGLLTTLGRTERFAAYWGVGEEERVGPRRFDISLDLL